MTNEESLSALASPTYGEKQSPLGNLHECLSRLAIKIDFAKESLENYERSREELLTAVTFIDKKYSKRHKLPQHELDALEASLRKIIKELKQENLIVTKARNRAGEVATVVGEYKELLRGLENEERGVAQLLIEEATKMKKRISELLFAEEATNNKERASEPRFEEVGKYKERASETRFVASNKNDKDGARDGKKSRSKA